MEGSTKNDTPFVQPRRSLLDHFIIVYASCMHLNEFDVKRRAIWTFLRAPQKTHISLDEMRVFDSCLTYMEVSHSNTLADFGSEGWGFESLRARQGWFSTRRANDLHASEARKDFARKLDP
jgi:hypothetical protein